MQPSSTRHSSPKEQSGSLQMSPRSLSSSSRSVMYQQRIESAIPECILQRQAPEWVQTGQLPSLSAALAQSGNLLLTSSESFTAVSSILQCQDSSSAVADSSSQSSWWALVIASRRALEDLQSPRQEPHQGHLEIKEVESEDQDDFPMALAAAPLIVCGTHRRRPAPSLSFPGPYPYQLTTPPPQDYPSIPADSQSTPPQASNPYRRKRSMSHTAMHVHQSRPSTFAFAPFGTRACIHIDFIEEGQEQCAHAYSDGLYPQSRLSAKCGRSAPRLSKAQRSSKNLVHS